MEQPLQYQNTHAMPESSRTRAPQHIGGGLRTALTTTLLSLLACQAMAWGSSAIDAELTMYGNVLTRDWLYDGSAVSMKLQGCVWGFVKDAQDAACLERSSQDGTTYWYMMANCRRAQAVYGLYSGTSCSNGNFKESVRICRVCELSVDMLSF
jgi:hypothetical protein